MGCDDAITKGWKTKTGPKPLEILLYGWTQTEDVLKDEYNRYEIQGIKAELISMRLVLFLW